MFHQINSTRVSIREYLYDGNWITKPILLLVAVVLKAFRIRIPGSTDIPPVTSLRPFLVDASTVPPELAELLEPTVQDLRRQGFRDVGSLYINDVGRNTRYAGQVMLSSKGDGIAWVRNRLWPQLPRHSRFTRVSLYSLFRDGTVVSTTSADRDLLDPPHWHVKYSTGANVDRLLDEHRQHLLNRTSKAPPRQLVVDEAIDCLDYVQEDFVKFQMSRGVFEQAASDSEEITIAEETAREAADSTVDPADSLFDPAGMVDELQPVIESVRSLETKRTQWLTKLIILFLSVALFVTFGAGQWGWELVLLLVPILFVHEMGHLIAMKWFGYKNVQMFFIPFLGAAVNGRHYQVDGWKKAFVSLAGPLPSIGMGIVLGIVAVVIESDLCMQAATLTLILNALNLLPLLPLDGGWVAHITIFSRSSLLDMIFRVGTIALVLIASIAFGDRILTYLAIGMAVGLPMVWKTMQVRDLLKDDPLPEATGNEIPEEAIRRIVSLVQQSSLPASNVDQLAATTVNVYESVSMKPPSWPATFGIWGLHGGGLVAACLGMLTLQTAMLWRLGSFDVPEPVQQNVPLDIADAELNLGDGDVPCSDLLMWQFADPALAEEAVESLPEDWPFTVTRLGFVVLSSAEAIPEIDAAPADDNDDWSRPVSIRERIMDQELQRIEDERLDRIAMPTRRRRSFVSASGYPVIVARFSTSDEQRHVVNSLSTLPPRLDNQFPVAPWCPRQRIDRQQEKLRRLLAILDGSARELPWAEAAPAEPDERGLESRTAEAFQEWLAEQEKRQQAQQKLRQDWIDEARRRAGGPQAALLTAYAQFEADVAKHGEDEPAGAVLAENIQQEAFPILTDYLRPFDADLGYLAPGALDFRFGAFASYGGIDREFDPGAVESEAPLTDNPLSARINVRDTVDAAAAFGGIIAWLKKQGATDVDLRYPEFAVADFAVVD